MVKHRSYRPCSRVVYNGNVADNGTIPMGKTIRKNVVMYWQGLRCKIVSRSKTTGRYVIELMQDDPATTITRRMGTQYQVCQYELKTMEHQS